jgi:hypothetical protein
MQCFTQQNVNMKHLKITCRFADGRSVILREVWDVGLTACSACSIVGWYSLCAVVGIMYAFSQCWAVEPVGSRLQDLKAESR